MCCSSPQAVTPWLALCYGVLGIGCERTADLPASAESLLAAPWFEECAEDAGLTFQHLSGSEGEFLMPEIMTTGAALFDADGDGDLDAYLVQGGAVRQAREERPGNQLFLNSGSGQFVDATKGSGADDRGYGMGATTGDYDGDGDVDLYVSNLGRNALLGNDGKANFEDRTEIAGAAGKHWSASAAFVDPDRDGDLDLYVSNYLFWSLESEIPCYSGGLGRTYCSPKSYEAPAPDEYFENQGDGIFLDRSEAYGVRHAQGNGLGVISADFDGDGAVEIVVANDGTPNQYWTQGEEGRFVDRALVVGCAVDDQGHAKAGMGVSVADIDSDGDEDLLIVNLTGEADSLYTNEGGFFVDRTLASGLGRVSRRRTRFGVSLRDFDQDSFLDVFQANGRVTHLATEPGQDPFAEENVVLRGQEGGRFEEVLPRGGVATALFATSRAAAFGDIDGDGDIDVLINNKDGAVHLLRNRAPEQGNWIGLDVRNSAGAPALGARLLVRFGDNQRRCEVRSAESYASASSPVIHLGLGELDQVSSVEVQWPDGTSKSLGSLEAGRYHVLRP